MLAVAIAGAAIVTFVTAIGSAERAARFRKLADGHGHAERTAGQRAQESRARAQIDRIPEPERRLAEALARADADSDAPGGLQGLQRMRGWLDRQRRYRASERSRMAREAERAERAAIYHGQMRRKYERAARYPWLPVDPDPTPPDSPLPVRPKTAVGGPGEVGLSGCHWSYSTSAPVRYQVAGRVRPVAPESTPVA
jgi:hypothetical protein